MRRTLPILLLTLTGLTGSAAAAHADEPTSVTIEDTANVLDEKTLLPKLRNADFHKPTAVAVYTYTAQPGGNVDLELLDYAREDHPEWLGRDGSSWSEGLYLVTLDTTSKKIGIHTGPDRPISQSGRNRIRDMTQTYRSTGLWDRAANQAVDLGGYYVSQPWHKHDAIMAAYWALGLPVAGYIGIAGWMAVRARKSVVESDARYMLVAADLRETNLHAAGIPGDTGYGARMLSEHQDFTSRHKLAVALGERARSRSTLQFYRARNRKLAKDYAAVIQDLSGADDTVADANLLLNKRPGWEDAWAREVQFLTEDLTTLERVTADMAFTTTAQALISWRARVEPLIPRWTEAVMNGSMSIEEGLDQLGLTRLELANLLVAHGESAVQVATQNTGEQDTMRRTMAQTAATQPRGFGVVERSYPEAEFVTVKKLAERVAHGRGLLEAQRSAAATRKRNSRM